MSGVLVIFSGGENPWFQSSNAKNEDLTRNPVGKGKSSKKTTTKTRASAKSAPEVIYPIFGKMVDLTTDPFWKTTFYEASIGKFHRGFRFNADTLTHKVRNKACSCNIAGMTIYEAIDTVQSFMRNTAGIMSSIDIENRNRDLKRFAAHNIENSIRSWGDVRSTDYRNILVAKYVSTLAEMYDLTEKEEEQLETVIKMGIILNRFNSSTIHVENSIIISIDGLYRQPDGIFAVDSGKAPIPKPSKTKSTVVETALVSYDPESGKYQYGEVQEDSGIRPIVTIDIMKKWNKIVKELEKKSHRHNHPLTAASSAQTQSYMSQQIAQSQYLQQSPNERGSFSPELTTPQVGDFGHMPSPSPSDCSMSSVGTPYYASLS